MIHLITQAGFARNPQIVRFGLLFLLCFFSYWAVPFGRVFALCVCGVGDAHTQSKHASWGRYVIPS